MCPRRTGSDNSTACAPITTRVPAGKFRAATQTLSTLLYQVVFRDGKVGLGAAFACILLVVVIALSTVFTRYVDRLQSKGVAK